MTKEEIAWAKELDLLTYFKLVEPGNLKLVGKPDSNSYAAMAYLRGRCIHPNVLAFCRKEGILYQTSFKNHPNCVFVGRDGESVAKGGSLRGCTQLQFRRDIPGSKKIYPFYIQASTKANTVEVYEAPIDAMSGASLKLMQHTGPWRSVHYLALGGTDYAALDAFLKYFPAVRSVVLCLDNDNAGRTRTQDIIAHLLFDRLFPFCWPAADQCAGRRQ